MTYTQSLICINVYFYCAGENSVVEYEINRFRTYKPNEKGEADIFEIFTNVKETYPELEFIEILNFFTSKDPENTGKLNFIKYYEAINELETYSRNTILRLNNINGPSGSILSNPNSPNETN